MAINPICLMDLTPLEIDLAHSLDFLLYQTASSVVLGAHDCGL
jgi:hypothetical protein